MYNWRTVAILVAWAAPAEGRSEVPFQVRLGPAEVGEVLLQGSAGGVLALGVILVLLLPLQHDNRFLHDFGVRLHRELH